MSFFRKFFRKEPETPLEQYDYPGDYAGRFDGIDPGGGEEGPTPDPGVDAHPDFAWAPAYKPAASGADPTSDTRFGGQYAVKGVTHTYGTDEQDASPDSPGPLAHEAAHVWQQGAPTGNDAGAPDNASFATPAEDPPPVAGSQSGPGVYKSTDGGQTFDPPPEVDDEADFPAPEPRDGKWAQTDYNFEKPAEPGAAVVGGFKSVSGMDSETEVVEYREGGPPTPSGDVSVPNATQQTVESSPGAGGLKGEKEVIEDEDSTLLKLTSDSGGPAPIDPPPLDVASVEGPAGPEAMDGGLLVVSAADGPMPAETGPVAELTDAPPPGEAPNFFDGRLLSAEDLRDEQTAAAPDIPTPETVEEYPNVSFFVPEVDESPPADGQAPAAQSSQQSFFVDETGVIEGVDPRGTGGIVQGDFNFKEEAGESSGTKPDLTDEGEAASEVTTLTPYGSFAGGVRVAVGDVDGSAKPGEVAADDDDGPAVLFEQKVTPGEGMTKVGESALGGPDTLEGDDLADVEI